MLKSSQEMVVLKYITAQKHRFDDCMLIHSIVCQIRDKCSDQRTLKGTERAVKLKKSSCICKCLAFLFRSEAGSLCCSVIR